MPRSSEIEKWGVVAEQEILFPNTLHMKQDLRSLTLPRESLFVLAATSLGLLEISDLSRA